MIEGLAVSAAQPIRLLVVEDDDSDYQLLLRHLRKEGYAVSALRVEDEPAFRAALAGGHWDAIVSDHNLPHYSSTGALGTLKELGLDLPFLIVSGQIGDGMAVDAMLAGADDYINKGRLARLGPALQRGMQAAEIRRQRRLAEAQLQEHQARLLAIASNMPGALFQIEHALETGALRLAFLSEGGVKLAGVTHLELMNDENFLSTVFYRDDAHKLGKLLRRPTAFNNTVEWEGRLNPGRLPSGERRARWYLVAASAREVSLERVLWEGVLTDITQQKRAQGQLARSQQQLRELTTHMEKIKESERAAISREIHDDIGGTLTGLKVDLEWLRKHHPDPAEVREKLDDMALLLESAVAASSRIMLALRPSVLDQGIVPAIEWQVRDFEKRLGIQCRLSCNHEELALAPETSIALFRILQEALTNTAKHAQATKVDVQLFATPTMVTLEVRDNGVGISAADQSKGGSFGLRGMRERVHSLSGWVDVGSAPGNGTTLMISIPFRKSKSQRLAT
jgi:two-component system, NarL family, sensor histidine kinase UhpB